MAHADFVHLRVHSAYSLSEGAIPIKELVRLAVDKKMPAVAITDTNNLFGALEFGVAAKVGVQPIIGCQLSITRETKSDGANGAGGHTIPTSDPLVLLVQNEDGYHNLLKLISLAYLGEPESEPPTEPEVTLSALQEYGNGLIALTGGPKGPVGQLLVNDQMDDAQALMARLKDIFPGNLYVELMRHGLAEEKKTEPGFLDMAYGMDIPIVATNECFFADASMHEAHDALICIAEGAYISDTTRRRLSPDNGFKSANEMRALFGDLPEAVSNTLVIAKRTAFMAESRPPILPPYDCGNGRTEEDELTAQAKVGLEARIKDQVFTPGMSADEQEHAAAPYRKRLAYELKVIDDMGFPGYFLIVADFIHWSKEQGIPVGPGRGSGAGSVVAWSLTITDLDPLRFGLLFERFLNPDRISMPDFDIDFCQDRRDEVIRYVQEKYGRDHVAQIITFGKLQARAVLRDVGRVLEMPYGYVDKICKLVPSNPANPPTLDEAMKAEPQIRQLAKEDPQVDKLIKIARKLEGLYRHASTHAAGVVIGDRPLDKLIPLYRDPRSDMPVSGFSMKYVEAAGLVKFDFLGLKTLTVLSRAEKLVHNASRDLDISTIPLDDKPTFDLIANGDTTGVFQLESSGMVQVLKNLQPDSFEDIIAVVALYRPGPMDNIPSYVKRKHGEEAPDYLYPTLEGILKETFGIIIYQEQVMQIAQELSGYSLGGADILRRAMGKKIRSEMAEQRQTFIKGATSKGVPEPKANEIFELVNKFADYGFNKSHAAAYALVAYQTAYMKANHPVEFMAASMTLDMGNTDKLSIFHQELKQMGIPVLGPDINASSAVFSVEGAGGGRGSIRYALSAIKNVGEAAMEGVVKEREENGPFKDLFDFAQRLDPHAVNKRQMENLVRAGAFNSLCDNRRQVYSTIEMLLRHASIANNERDSGQMGLFGGESAGAFETPSLPEITDWQKMDRLNEEFDATGLYLSGHPLDDFGHIMKRLKLKTKAAIMATAKPGAKRMAGTLLGVSERTSKKGNRYAFLSFTDTSGVFEAIAFSEVMNDNRDILEAGQSFFIRAQLDGDGRFSVQGLQLLEKAGESMVPGLSVVVASATPLNALKDVLSAGRNGRGHVTVVSRLEQGAEVDVELTGGYSLTPDVINAVRAIPGVVETRET